MVAGHFSLFIFSFLHSLFFSFSSFLPLPPSFSLFHYLSFSRWVRSLSGFRWTLCNPATRLLLQWQLPILSSDFSPILSPLTRLLIVSKHKVVRSAHKVKTQYLLFRSHRVLFWSCKILEVISRRSILFYN